MKSSKVSLYEFGYSFLAPVLNLYTRQVVKHAHGHRVICLAREGWLFHKLLDKLIRKNLISIEHAPVYLKVSRTLLFRSMLGDPEGWEYALENKFEGSVLNLMMKRFGLQMHEVYNLLPSALLDFTLSLPTDKVKVIQWLTPHKQRLQCYVEPTRDALERYLARELNGVASQTPLMLDIGYAGTIQKIITRIIKRDTCGLYFIANSSEPHPVGSYSASMRGVLKENIKWSTGYLMLERSLLLESILTAPHGQVIDIRCLSDGEFDFYYGQAAGPQTHSQDLEAIFEGAIDGVEEGLRLNIEYSVEDIENLYVGFATSPSAIPEAAFHLFNVDDDFSGTGVISPMKLFSL